MATKATGQKASLDEAYRYLAYRPRSEAEVRAWLCRKGYSRPAVESTLAALKARGLLNDAEFARFWVERRETSGPRSRAALRRELRQKGIDTELIDETISGIDDEATAYRAAQRKMGRLARLDRDEFRSKLVALLRRRGFSYEIAENTANRLCREDMKNV